MAQYKKGKASQEKILKAGYQSIARIGYHKTTFESISLLSGFSQASIVKIFKSKKQIFPIVADFVWQEALANTELKMKEVENSNSPKELISFYFNISTQYFSETEDMKAFYLNFYLCSHYDDRLKEINQALKAGAENRLAGFLKKIKIPARKRKELAYYIHSSLTGYLLNYCIDDDKKRLKTNVNLFLSSLDLEEAP